MRLKVLAAVLGSVVLASGCGGGSAQKSDPDQIRDTTKTFVSDLLNEDYAGACSVSTVPDKCMGDLAMAQAFLGKNGSWKTVFGSSWESKMAQAKITVHGNQATMAAWSASGRQNNNPTDFKKISGKWLLDMTDNSSSSSEQQGSSTTNQAVPADAVLKTDAQAQAYLKANLKTWDGIDLTKASYVDAFCNNGYYSKTETRTGKHLPGYQGQTNTAGEDVFPSFQCQLSVGSRSFGLYVVPTTTGAWTIQADR